MNIEPCGLNKGVINYLRQIALYGINNHYSDYYNDNVINLNITETIQIDVRRNKKYHNKIDIIALGVRFKTYTILECQIYSTINKIKEEFK